MDTILFVLSKIVVPFFSPLFLILLVWLVILVRLPRNSDNRRARRGMFVAWIVCFVLSLPAVAEGFVRLWEEPPSAELPPSTVDGKPSWDAVVVLGGGLDPAGSKGWQISVNDAAERLETAARLYHLGLAPCIVVSGGSGDIHAQDLKEGPLMKRLLVELGVPATLILMDETSRNTFENARETRALLQANGKDSILLVTSALHMKRSAAIFRKAGFAMQTLTVDSLSQPLVVPESFIPDARALWTLSRVLREMVGYGYYLVLGRL